MAVKPFYHGYKILESSSLFSLQDMVSSEISMGYQPHGSMSSIFLPSTSEGSYSQTMFIQPMVKITYEEVI